MSNADELRALAMEVMVRHAAIKPRGFDSIKAREALQRQWDDIYDDYLLESLIDCEPVA